MTDLGMRQPEVAERVLRAFDIKGDLPQLMDPRFQLSMNAEDLTAPEYGYLRRRGRFMAGARLAPTAGRYAVLGLRYAAAQTVQQGVAVCETIILSNENATAMQYLIRSALYNPAFLTTVAQADSGLDDRQVVASTVSSMLEVCQSDNVGLAINYPAIPVQVPAGSSVQLNLNVVMTNVDKGLRYHILVQPAVVTVTSTVAFIWSERAILTSEAR